MTKTTENKITFGVELEFLVPFLCEGDTDPAPGNGSENRPVTWVRDAEQAFDAIQLEICALLKKHKIPVVNDYEFTHQSILTKGLPQHWCIGRDGSVAEQPWAYGYLWAGVELRSPVLPAGDEASYARVSEVVTLLRDHFRTRVNLTTGLHVHVGMGVSPLPPHVVHRLAQLLWCADGMLSGLHPPERILGTHAPSIRHESHLAFGNHLAWEKGEEAFNNRRDHHRKPRKRDTKRGSLDIFNEGAEIWRRTDICDKVGSGDEKESGDKKKCHFPTLRRYAEAAMAAAAQNPGPEEEEEKEEDHVQVSLGGKDERDFLHALRAAYKYSRKAAMDASNNEDTQKELFGNWNWPEQEDEADPGSPRVDLSWVMDTGTIVSTTWAELIGYGLNDDMNNKGRSVDAAPHAYEDTDVPGGGDIEAEAEIFSNIRKNPFQDPGARARYFALNGLDIPDISEEEWPSLDDDEVVPPTTPMRGLLFMTAPELYDDTRRAAYLVTSARGARCNYNFNTYGFPAATANKKPIMTIEFREATGSLNPDWNAVWASICTGLVEYCLAADEGHFVEVLLRVAEAEKNETMVRVGHPGGDPSLLGYDIVSFLADIELVEEASFVANVLGRGDKGAFWFPCTLFRKKRGVSLASPEVAVGEEGVAVLPPVTFKYRDE